MHGLGNDFMVIDGVSESIHLTPDLIRVLAHRRRGVGFDQLLLLESSPNKQADFNYRIFNADGNEVEQCGNGARCIAQFVQAIGLTDSRTIRFNTQAGIVTSELLDGEQVCVDMGAPNFEPSSLPLNLPEKSQQYTTEIIGHKLPFGALSMGNPHVVIDKASMADLPLETVAMQLQNDLDLFPQGINVGFLQIQGRDALSLRVFERGVGETQACGSGACAAMVMARVWGLVDESIHVTLPGGMLQIQWAGLGSRVYMTGPTSLVYHGEMNLAI